MNLRTARPSEALPALILLDLVHPGAPRVQMPNLLDFNKYVAIALADTRTNGLGWEPINCFRCSKRWQQARSLRGGHGRPTHHHQRDGRDSGRPHLGWKGGGTRHALRWRKIYTWLEILPM